MTNFTKIKGNRFGCQISVKWDDEWGVVWVRNVLIVDDQQGIRLLLEEVFKKEGYGTKSAANGGEALQQVKNEQPDCILLDMKMPGMDGIDVLRQLKKEWPEIPVIMMTAYEELKLVEHALEIGAEKYFTKPFDIFEVRDAVNLLLAS
ncbi:Sporulation initiation phosphotransferase F [Sporosarcina pasteurii]|uniref:Sporulation initiation phosphotransferase F n=1 Tax=Sporosarcina pasteurii TaxID=1474 RepID=A0A380BCD0_SPOPA|nr:Sporulation initiation phosphotransferase F [Sporosarcina pasteurii]